MRSARLWLGVSFIGALLAGAFVVACSSAYSTTDVSGDGSAADARDDGFAAEDGGGAIGDGGTVGMDSGHPTDAADGSKGATTFCSGFPAALWCDDFDESLDARAVGVTLQETLGAVTVGAGTAESAPNSLRTLVVSPDGGQLVQATLTKTVPFATTLTAKVSIYAPSIPTGYATTAFAVTTGATSAQASTLSDGQGGVTIFWELSFGASSIQASTSIPISSYHALEVQIALGEIHVLVDGTPLGKAPLTAPGNSATVLVGQFDGQPVGPKQSTMRWDDVLVTSP